MNYDMANFGIIADIANRSSRPKISLDYCGDFGTDCYNAGAIEILKHIAELVIEKHEVPVSNYTLKRKNEKEEAYLKLKNTIQETEHPLLKDLDYQWRSYSSGEAHDHFIEGFIRGYAFLKSHITHGGGDL